MATQVVDKSAFEHGSLGKQVGLSVITLGLYPLYWTYKTASQLSQGTDANLNPILVFIPLYGQWIFADAAEGVTDQSSVVLFLLFMFLGPAAWFLIQTGINDIAPGT